MKKLKNIKGLAKKGLLIVMLALALFCIGNWVYDNFDVLTYAVLQPDKVRLMKNYQMLKLDQADEEFKQMFEIIEELKK